MEKIIREHKVIMVTARSWNAFQKCSPEVKQNIYKYIQALSVQVEGLSLAGAMDLLYEIGVFLNSGRSVDSPMQIGQKGK